MAEIILLNQPVIAGVPIAQKIVGFTTRFPRHLVAFTVQNEDATVGRRPLGLSRDDRGRARRSGVVERDPLAANEFLHDDNTGCAIPAGSIRAAG